MNPRFLKLATRVFALVCAVLIPVAMNAQTGAKPAASGGYPDSPSKVDFSFEYSYLNVHGTLNTYVPAPYNEPISAAYSNVNVGGLFGVSYWINKNFGLQGEFAEHEWGTETQTTPVNIGSQGNNDGFLSIQGGLIGRVPMGKLTPWAHVLYGGVLADGPVHNPYTWGYAETLGGGLDYQTPWLHHHLSLRIIQADYDFFHVNFGDNTYLGGTTNIDNARISAGFVIRAGSIAPPPAITIACSANPVTVFPGDPVTISATAGGLDPKLHAVYSFGGKDVTASGETATVATANEAAGTYTVDCGVKEGKPGKEGLKPWEVASSTAMYTVKAYEPPTVSCSASPATIKPGESSTITSLGVSPQNRPLTYTYSASSGSVSGSGTTATFSSTGAATGSVGITCSVSDDKGQTASGSTMVTITAPYVAPIPHTQALCSITFSKDKKRPTRVDNEAKACLDEVALDLQKQSDAKAVIVGEATVAEKTLPKHHRKSAKVPDVAGERAVNTKEYLVTEKGIDASRVSVATGTTDGQTVEDYLVPSGATFSSDVSGTTPVDETAVKPVVRKPLGEKHHMKKKAAAAAK